MQSEENATHSECFKAVVDNHLTYCYFKQCLDNFLHHWLDTGWHCFRFEYQAIGSIHAHGCAKLKNDPNIPLLGAKAAQGSFYTEKASQEDTEFFYQGDRPRWREEDCEVSKEQIAFNFKKYLKKSFNM